MNEAQAEFESSRRTGGCEHPRVSVGTANAAPTETRDKADQTGLTRSTAASLVADSIGAVGTSAYHDTFSGIHVNPATGEVAVFATDAVRGRQLTERGLAATPASAKSATEANVRVSKHSRAHRRT